MTYRGKVFIGIVLVVVSQLAWVLFSGSVPQNVEVVDRVTILENRRKAQITQKRGEIDRLLQEGMQQSEKLFGLIRSMYAVEVFTAIQLEQEPILDAMNQIKAQVDQFEATIKLLSQEKNSSKISELFSKGIGQIEELSHIPEAACLVDIKNLQHRLLVTTAVSLATS